MVLKFLVMDKDILDFDISVAAAKKKVGSTRKSYPGEEDSHRGNCHISGCERKGKYRAPASPDKLNEFLWFCKQHIKTYNTQWNFYKNKKIGDIDEAGRGGVNTDPSFTWSNYQDYKSHEIYDEKNNPGNSIHTITKLRLSKTEQRASEILDLEGNFSKSDARNRYRILVKDLHPDMNNGDRADEDRLKEVVWAWDQIKRSRKIPDL